MENNINRFECHLHSMYSNIRLIDAISKPEDIIKRALDIGLNGICLTDHETLAGHIKMNKLQDEIQKEHPDFKIGLGNEIYLVDERPSQKHPHFILIAKDKEGHKQLRQLSSLAWMNSYFSKGLERVDTLKVDLDRIVRQNKGHLIGSTACLGSELDIEILNLIEAEKNEEEEKAKEAHDKIVNFILWCKDLFGEDFYIECQPAQSKEQILVNQRLMSISKCFNIKMIVTTDAHYLKKEDRYVHKAYLNSKQAEREVDTFYQYAYLQDNDEVFENLKASNFDKLFITELLNNTMEIYNKIENYSLLHSQQIPKVEVKNYPIIKNESVAEFNNLYNLYQSKDQIERYWVNECVKALENKFPDLYENHIEYLEELEEEADVKRVIGEKLDTNMYGYPVLLQHYINLIWECGSTIGVGRGSACSALNHYLLGITQLDPVQWKFPFFRYMNRERIELGDIDIDIAPSKRPLFINKVKEERKNNFLPELDELSKRNLGATYIATFGTEGTKSAILTACRGYRSEEYPNGIDVDIAQYLASLVPVERGFLWSIDELLNGNEEKGRKPVKTFINEVNQFPGLLDIIKGIEGIINKRSSHASGIIMQDEDPYRFGCFMRTPKGEIITQYDLHDCEAARNDKIRYISNRSSR